MFLRLFSELRAHKVPVSLREFLDFLAGVKSGLVTYDVDGFYFLARGTLVKDERNIDKFDRAFAKTFEGLAEFSTEALIEALDLPQEWLEKLAEKHLSDAEKAEIQAMGGFDKLMETLKKRLEEQDLNNTIRATAENGYLDVKTRSERRNAVKVLLFLDVGGSMDPYVKIVEELFSAARTEFKNLEYFYFHNCLYEGVWRDNRRRWDAQTPTWEILRTYGSDYKCIFVGDASMSPYEIAYPGGANEHWNEEAGQVWLARAFEQWPNSLWINPSPERYWRYTQSIEMIGQIIGRDRMVPMTLSGIEAGMKVLGR